MVTSALIPERFLYENEKRRLFFRDNLTRRRDVDEQLTPGCKQLFSNQYSERGPHRVANNAEH